LTPLARSHLDKARHSLANARIILAANLPDEAGRVAYISAFHAAQALISERMGTAPKTHAGVHGQFGKLAKDDPHFDILLRRFLSQAYELKTVADYDLEPDAGVSPDRAASAIETAARFLECTMKSIGDSDAES
jgi:uncharacterized protein (UPF0332 family)